ncbi:MAG TPA: flagellar hook-associated protein FlgK [Steroidobacteraceae bacterium]|nr:flagellar hook-associated protein FlgK [Steroidobacteraceae bacterium]
MANAFGIDLSALQAFQQAITVTSNNVANANTPGYDVESIQLSSAPPQANGLGLNVGAGVVVDGVTRAYSQTAANQLNSTQAGLGSVNALQSYASQIDNLFGTTAGGLSTALQSYYNAWSTVSNAPSSGAAREALLGAAQSLATNINTSGAQLQQLDTSINTGITSDVQQINSYASSIASLNQQIVTASASGKGQSPNELLDQRDQLVSKLASLVGVTTSTNSDGSLNVFIGTGQPLVLENSTTTLKTIANPFNASQLEIASSDSNGNSISSSITSGDLGGLLAARSQVVNPALNQLGQIATAVAVTSNAQQGKGLDLNGQLGGALFSIAAPLANASVANQGNASLDVAVANVGALTADNYQLSYSGSAYTLTDLSTGASVALAGAGTAANPFTAAGLSIVVSGAPAAGDAFLIQPTAQAPGSLSVALSDPNGIAAAGALATSAADTNTGTARIGSASVIDPTNPNLLASTTLKFTSPTTYSINGAGSFAYTSGGTISQDGWQVTISGVPAPGDTFTVASNVGATGDNSNALASANQQNQGVLGNGQTSIGGAVSTLVTAIGSQTQQLNTAQSAQSALNSQAQSAVQSASGVNLDTEAANLLQWQQAYQAAAQALTIANSLFTDLINSIK